jgi:hypothetical protein
MPCSQSALRESWCNRYMLVRVASRLAAASAVASLLAIPLAQAQRDDFTAMAAKADPGFLPNWTELPDWSGVWAETGNTVFDHASVVPAGGSANDAGTREYPPLTDSWESVYASNLARVADGLFPDPITNCGVPVGFPRIFNLPDVYEFVVRPEQTWILTENGPNVMRIYTDGRTHPAPEDLWGTFTGDSVGYWDEGTLVFSTIAVKNEGTILDRTGLTMSDEMTAMTRMRKVEDDLIELEMTIEDPIALTEPWHVTMRYERLPEGVRVYDYACAENNRNPVTQAGQTITLGPDGEPLDFLGEE